MISVVDLLILSQVPNIGASRLRTLVSHYNCTGEIFQTSAREIAKVEGFSKKLASSTTHFFRNSLFDEARRYAEHQLSRLNKVGGRAITYWDKTYPEYLKKIYDPPPFLFMHGEL